MLVLTRKPHESVVITCEGIDIEVVIIKVRGKQVTVGFDADKSVKINRKEIIGKGKNNVA